MELLELFDCGLPKLPIIYENTCYFCKKDFSSDENFRTIEEGEIDDKYGYQVLQHMMLLHFNRLAVYLIAFALP